MSRKGSKRTVRVVGYGQALILQGMFLLLFDAVLSQALMWNA